MQAKFRKLLNGTSNYESKNLSSIHDFSKTLPEHTNIFITRGKSMSR